MYIHIGNDIMLRDKNIIGIFDLDSTTVSKRTRNFLSHAQKEKRIVNATYDLPKTFIVESEKRQCHTVYLSQLSSGTLAKRTAIKTKEITNE